MLLTGVVREDYNWILARRMSCGSARLQYYRLLSTIAFYHQRRRWSADYYTSGLLHQVRNLGVDFDSEMTMRAHIAKTTQTCFFISDVYARSVGCWGVMLPVHLSRRSFVLIRVWCNAVDYSQSQVYHSLPLHLDLQRVLNAAMLVSVV